MELRVGLWTLCRTLVLDILANDFFVPVATDRTDEVAFGPECPTPELLLDRRHTGKNFPGGETLDDFHDLRWAIRGHRLHEKMHMVVVCPDLQKGDLVPFGNVHTDLFQHGIDFLTHYDPSRLCRTPNVVNQGR